ncbi:MAG TPA: hypothetical protein VF143_04270 [Candidatus Nanopelagicales bacterium]
MSQLAGQGRVGGPRSSRRLGPGLAALLLGLAALAGVPPAGAAPHRATPAGASLALPAAAPPTLVGTGDRVMCRLPPGELDEISGMALSRRHDDVLWATNDSGGGPYLYAVSTVDCRVRARLTLLDTPARDHEALATGTDAEGRDVIWIGDIGDNVGAWPYARIHKVVEPRRLRDARVPVTTYRVRYPGGPENAEALLAAPDREQLWIITKESGVGSILEVPSPMSPAREPMLATRVGSARSLVTDAAMAPNGKRYVVRDYLSAEVFDGEPPGEAQARFALPIQPQGEAVTWTADSKRLLVASEGSRDLVEVTVPRTALGTDGGIAGSLPRVAGFDIYPYARVVVLAVTLVVALVALRRVFRRRR